MNSNIYFLLYLIIILTILLLYRSENNYNEYYDAKINNITDTECGNECTQAPNCVGFGYKPTERSCYLSKKIILGEPIKSLYENEYSKLDRRCNKINKIDDIDYINNITLVQNSIYMCSDGENNVNTQFQYGNDGASSLESTVPKYLAPEYVKYKVNYINWPKEKDDYIHMTGKKLTNASKLEKGYGFIESNKEFLGQYMLAHQCVANIPFYDCLKFCENDPKCAGTEWNKSIIKNDGKNNVLYENVCCPKSIIRKIIPRRKQFSRGNFYVKKDLESIIGRDRITLTKANFKIPTNNKFQLDFKNYDKSDLMNPRTQDQSNVKPTIAKI